MDGSLAQDLFDGQKFLIFLYTNVKSIYDLIITYVVSVSIVNAISNFYYLGCMIRYKLNL